MKIKLSDVLLNLPTFISLFDKLRNQRLLDKGGLKAAPINQTAQNRRRIDGILNKDIKSVTETDLMQLIKLMDLSSGKL